MGLPARATTLCKLLDAPYRLQESLPWSPSGHFCQRWEMSRTAGSTLSPQATDRAVQKTGADALRVRIVIPWRLESRACPENKTVPLRPIRDCTRVLYLRRRSFRAGSTNLARPVERCLSLEGSSKNTSRNLLPSLEMEGRVRIRPLPERPHLAWQR